MNKLLERIALLNDWIGRSVAWCSLLMVLVGVCIVILRYFFQVGWVAMQESMVYLHATLLMLGMAYTLSEDGHVRVDIVYRHAGNTYRYWVNLMGTVLFALPIACFLLWVCWDYVFAAWRIKESSREAGGIPLVYLLKSLLLFMPILLILQCLTGIAKQLKKTMPK